MSVVYCVILTNLGLLFFNSYIYDQKMQPKMSKNQQYIEPQIDTFELLETELLASSPTGEDFTEPEDYNGF